MDHNLIQQEMIKVKLYICKVRDENPCTYWDGKPPLHMLLLLLVQYLVGKLTTWNQAMATIDLL